MANRTYCPSCGQRIEQAVLDLDADRPGSVLPILQPCGHRASPVKAGPRAVTDRATQRIALGSARRSLLQGKAEEGKGKIVPGVDLEIIVNALEDRLDAEDDQTAAVADA